MAVDAIYSIAGVFTLAENFQDSGGRSIYISEGKVSKEKLHYDESLSQILEENRSWTCDRSK